MIFELAKDFAAALSTLPQEHPKHRILRLLEEAIRRDIRFIARRPTLFQRLWNTCGQYDCLQAAGHRVEPDESKLCGLLERWRAATEWA